ncbi:MAG: sugar transferase [Deltaproteobacteria bacterium]|nr:sugar transferase [Deltaproteobacteria bacterium]
MSLLELPKRALDLALASVTTTLLVPLLPAIAAAIRFEGPGPIFFQCPRLGKLGRPIRLWKFRTMIHNAPERFNADGSRLVEAKDSRVTRVGAILRGGLDELPQALSVLRGELSFIGPRPDDLFAIDMYRDAEWLKLSITPGITGLAQVNGRNDLPYRERLKYDIYYALHRTMWLDLRILTRTVLLAVGARPTSSLVDFELVEQVAASSEALARGAEVERVVRSSVPR